MKEGTNGNAIPEEAFDIRAKKKPVVIKAIKMSTPFFVDMPEGRVHGKPGDYLLIGIAGERYPCRADIFEESYSIVNIGESDGKKTE